MPSLVRYEGKGQYAHPLFGRAYLVQGNPSGTEIRYNGFEMLKLAVLDVGDV